MPIDIQFNEHLPGFHTWQTMTQEELIQYLETQNKAQKAEVGAKEAPQQKEK